MSSYVKVPGKFAFGGEGTGQGCGVQSGFL